MINEYEKYQFSFQKKKYKISQCDLPKLQIVICYIKVNSNVPRVCQKNNLG
jgi:hypothetical protein